MDGAAAAAAAAVPDHTWRWVVHRGPWEDREALDVGVGHREKVEGRETGPSSPSHRKRIHPVVEVAWAR